MTLPQAWMQQAESDFRTAERVDNVADARTRCQAISKYQQCVEKSIKGVLDKLFAEGLIAQGSDRGHRVARYAGVLSGFPVRRTVDRCLTNCAACLTKMFSAKLRSSTRWCQPTRRKAFLRVGIMNIHIRLGQPTGVRLRTNVLLLSGR